MIYLLQVFSAPLYSIFSDHDPAPIRSSERERPKAERCVHDLLHDQRIRKERDTVIDLVCVAAGGEGKKKFRLD